MQLNKKRKFALFLLVVFLLVSALSMNAGKKVKDPEYGVTFSYVYAQHHLGLDWKETYKSTLEELKVKKLRIPVYWNEVERKKDEFNFEAVDFQLDLASKHNAKVVLAIGRRLPRWPECHDPSWLKELPQSSQDNELLSYLETVVGRYQAHPAVEIWQVENEPFLGSFGECPLPRPELLDSEISLVKKLDPGKPILISDSGELSSWIQAGKRGDVFGTTLYRYVFSDVFNRYWVNYIPYWFYRVKGGLLRLLHPRKPIMIVELQAEPWTTKGIPNTSIEEQFKTMSPDKFKTMLGVAKATGYSPQYFWGVEWWYYMKVKQSHPEFWEESKSLFNE
jgi:hypothetical protein